MARLADPATRRELSPSAVYDGAQAAAGPSKPKDVIAPAWPGLTWTRAHEVVARFAGHRRLAADLLACEAAMARVLPTDVPWFEEVAQTAVMTGGKRLRPLFLLAAAYGAEAPETSTMDRRLALAGAAVELLHAASLVHDDVMDESETRHGKPSVRARWSDAVAVLCGDYLLADAFGCATRLGVRQARIIACAFEDLCIGQARETGALFDATRTEDEYFATVQGKTGALLSAACRLGAIEGGLAEPAVDALSAYGRSVGIAFQITDDLLDITASTDVLGKPAGRDVAMGVYTLPLLRALRLDQRIVEALPAGGEATVPEVLRLVQSTPALDTSRATAAAFVERAIRALAACNGQLSDGGIAMFADLARSLVDRVR